MNRHTMFLLEITQKQMMDIYNDLESLLIALRAIETDDPKSQAIKIAFDIALTSNVERVFECAGRVTDLVEEGEVEGNYHE